MQQGTISWLDYDLWLGDKRVDFIQPATNQVSGWTKKKLPSTSQSQTCIKRRSQSLFGGLLQASDPLQLSETITSEKYSQQINEMHWKPQHLQPMLANRLLLYYNAWSPVTPPMLQKLNKLGYKALIHPLYSSDLSLTDYHFFKHFDNFLQGKCFHYQQEAESAFQEFTEF